MHPKPKRLALLISLIGVGVAPAAWARSELRVLREAPPCLQDLLIDTAADAVASDDPRWLPPGRALDTSAATDGWLLYAAAPDDESPEVVQARMVADAAAPGETPGTTAEDQSTEPDEAIAIAGVRVRVPVPIAGATPMRILAAGDALGLERSTRAEFLPATEALPTPTDRALEELAAVVANMEAPRSVAVSVADESADALDNVEPLAERGAILRREADVPRRDLPEVVVDTESSKVLRLLGALRFDERDEVGAVKPEADIVVVPTQADKVLAMLDEIAGPARVDVEDGPTKRARKLAAIAAAAHVDVMLPLEPPTAGLANDAPTEPPMADAPALSPTLIAQAALLNRASPFGDQPLALDESRLDGVRGGFVGDGLSISFGIERAVYVNGSLVTTTSLNLSDLGRMTAGRGTASLDAGSIALVQSGAGNVVTSGLTSSSAIGTVIQNTLDGQKIQSLTVINASTNSLGVLRTLNFQSSLRGAVIDSLRR